MSWFHKPPLEIHLFPPTLTTSLEVVLLQRGSNASLCWTGFPCSAQPCLNSSAAAFEGLIIGPLFARMFWHQSGKHKASSHFCALWATLCVKAFNDCVPFCSVSDSVLSLHSPASHQQPATQALCLLLARGQEIQLQSVRLWRITSLHFTWRLHNFAIKMLNLFLFGTLPLDPNQSWFHAKVYVLCAVEGIRPQRSLE